MLDCLIRPFLYVSLCLLMVISLILACERPTPNQVKYNIVYRNNNDGTITKWEVFENIILKEGFVCWERKDNGNTFCISGEITIVPVVIRTPIQE